MIAAALDMRRMSSPRSAITQASIHAHGETTFVTSKNASTAKTAVMPAIAKATAAPSLQAAARQRNVVIDQAVVRPIGSKPKAGKTAMGSGVGPLLATPPADLLSLAVRR